MRGTEGWDKGGEGQTRSNDEIYLSCARPSLGSLASFLPSKASSISHLIFQSSALRNALPLFLSPGPPFVPDPTRCADVVVSPF